MKNTNLDYIYSLFFTLLFLAIATVADAQILPPPPPPLPPGSTGVPLDPFSWVLLGAGGAAAYKRYRNNKKKEEAKDIL